MLYYFLFIGEVSPTYAHESVRRLVRAQGHPPRVDDEEVSLGAQRGNTSTPLRINLLSDVTNY